MNQLLTEISTFVSFPLPVISTGVTCFMILTYISSIFSPNIISNWSLSPNSLLNGNTTSLTTFPLIHVNFLHLLSNIIVLYHPLSQFENSHGSLHTALLLNTLGAITGIAFTIISLILNYIGIESDDSLNVSILGSSGWAFTFLTINCCYNSINNPYTTIYNTHYNVPTIFLPLIYLIISFILVPSSSFLGHFVSIILGVLIFKNYIAFLAIPPFNLLGKIENLNIFKYSIESIFPIELFKWTWENDVKEIRYQLTDFNNPNPILPTHNEQNSGEKLGTNKNLETN